MSVYLTAFRFTWRNSLAYVTRRVGARSRTPFSTNLKRKISMHLSALRRGHRAPLDRKPPLLRKDLQAGRRRVPLASRPALRHGGGESLREGLAVASTFQAWRAARQVTLFALDFFFHHIIFLLRCAFALLLDSPLSVCTSGAFLFTSTMFWVSSGPPHLLGL